MTQPLIYLTFANEGNNQDARFLRNLTREKGLIEDTLRPAELNDRAAVVSESDVTIDEIYRTFQDERYRDKIVIYHYAGHATGDELLVETRDGSNTSFFGSGLAKFLGLQKSLRLVFLNGCSTQKHAQRLIQEGVPAVIATSYAIEDEAAVLFAKIMYQGLAGGASIERAFQEAQSSMQARYGSEDRMHRSIFWEGMDMEDVKKAGPPWELFIKDSEAEWPSSRWKLFFELPKDENENVQEINDYTLLGQEIRGYKIERHLGVGSYGSVFKAKHMSLDKEVAIKVSHKIISGYDRIRRVIYTGARGLTKLNHSHIAATYDVGELSLFGDKRIFIIMELVSGNRLDKIDFRLAELKRKEILGILDTFLAVCEAIEAAHQTEYEDGFGFRIKGVVHGNIKTRKILFEKNGKPKVIDFMFTDLTRNNNVVFETPKEFEAKIKKENNETYFPPERLESSIVSIQTDVYSLGAVLFKILTQQSVKDFSRLSANDIQNVLQNANPHIPNFVSKIIFNAIHPDTNQRYPSVSMLMYDLERNRSIFRRIRFFFRTLVRIIRLVRAESSF